MDHLFTYEAFSSFAVLTLMEVILGIDNLVFISILSEKLKEPTRKRAQRLGLAFALITRLMFLATLVWIAHLSKPLFTIMGADISARTLVLVGGGLFLIIKGTLEIHQKVEDHASLEEPSRAPKTLSGVVMQIAIMDIVFSMDSIITAIGMAKHVEIMIAAVLVSMVVMMACVHQVSAFINNNPTIKMLALSFLLLIGMSLVAEGIGFEIPKGYIYFAMFFSLFVEMINIWAHTRERKK